jgi:hypothetical protein
MPRAGPASASEGAPLSAAKRLHLGAWPSGVERQVTHCGAGGGVLDDPSRTVGRPTYALADAAVEIETATGIADQTQSAVWHFKLSDE